MKLIENLSRLVKKNSNEQLDILRRRSYPVMQKLTQKPHITRFIKITPFAQRFLPGESHKRERNVMGVSNGTAILDFEDIPNSNYNSTSSPIA